MQTGWDPLAVMVAPNGAYKQKSDHPRLPVTPDELAACAARCLAAGASMLHLHVRDASGGHTLDVGGYREAIDAIRERVGDKLVIQATSEAARRFSPDQQMAAMRALQPESASFAIRELVPDAAAEKGAARFFAWAAEAGIIAQFILYSHEDLLRFIALRRRGVIPGERHFLLFVLGRYAEGQQSNPSDLLPFVSSVPETDTWAVCAFGHREAAVMQAAAALGGHARVGFENNLYLADGTPAADNSALVAQVAAGASAMGRPLATASEMRSSLRTH